MATQFEIWDNDTANIVFAYETVQDALADVREEIALNGPEAVQSWVLQHDDGVNPPENILAGVDLIRYASAHSAPFEPAPHD